MQTLQGQRLSFPGFFVPQQKGREAEVWGPRAEGMVSRDVGTTGGGRAARSGWLAATAQMDGPSPSAESTLSGQPRGKKKHPPRHGSEQKRDLIPLPPPLRPRFALGPTASCSMGSRATAVTGTFKTSFPVESSDAAKPRFLTTSQKGEPWPQFSPCHVEAGCSPSAWGQSCSAVCQLSGHGDTSKLLPPQVSIQVVVQRKGMVCASP